MDTSTSGDGPPVEELRFPDLVGSHNPCRSSCAVAGVALRHTEIGASSDWDPRRMSRWWNAPGGTTAHAPVSVVRGFATVEAALPLNAPTSLVDAFVLSQR